MDDLGNFGTGVDESGRPQLETKNSGLSEFDDDELDPELLASDANILKLDEDRMSASVINESEDDRQFEDQGTMSDEEPQLSPDGILDENTIAQGLSTLGRSADGTQHVYLHMTLPGFSLNDISLLSECIHLQKVEIPYNEITDLSALSSMEYLLELDASNNQISTLLDFTPPRNLKSVNLAYNNIQEMSDLSAHHYLTSINLDNNNIKEIQGLQNCKRLSSLSLAHNKIEKIQGLDHLPIKNLNLSSNQLTKMENLETLKYLQTVNFSRNQIRSLEGLNNHEFLENIEIEDNEVIDISEIQFVKSLRMLRQLNLLRNPIQELPDYRLSILYHIQRITELDRRKVEVEEKVAATNLFAPPIEVIASRDHIMHVVYSFLQPSKVLDSTLPGIDTPYPMLVIVGPQGSGKKDLALKLVEEFPDYFGYGISHTTRRPQADEVNGKDYHFVSVDQFENDVKMGKFIQTYSYHGNLYGLTMESIESVARESLACIVHMELEGVLTLKNTHLEPRYVLIMPLSLDSHERRLREKGIYTETQIQWTLERAQLYGQHNREHPGFFDMMINSDDIMEAYRRLRRLVMDYLGIAAPSPSVSDLGLDQSQTGSQFFEKEATETFTVGSANMGARTWSKPSIPDSMTQAVQSVLQKAMSPMPQSGRGIVEEESLKRRQSAAKEAVAGHRPSIYEQILNKAPRTVPQPVSALQGLGDDTDPAQRSYSAPVKENMDALPPGSPDSSDGKDSSSSSLSNISEAHDMDDDDDICTPEETPKGSQQEGISAKLPQETVDPLELMSASGSKSMSGGPMAPRGSRPGSQIGQGSRPPTGQGSRPGTAASVTSNRLGSDKHLVLPPIGTPTNSAQPEV